MQSFCVNEVSQAQCLGDEPYTMPTIADLTEAEPEQPVAKPLP